MYIVIVVVVVVVVMHCLVQEGLFMLYLIGLSQKVYSLQLLVYDSHGASDTTTLTVTVLDINDNPPIFNPDYYTGTILGNCCKACVCVRACVCMCVCVCMSVCLSVYLC